MEASLATLLPAATTSDEVRLPSRGGPRRVVFGEVPATVRQAKPGKGGSVVDSRRQSGNLSDGTRQVQILPGKGWPPAGSESCVGIPRGRLRSVDSEAGGRVNEPRKALVVGVVHVVSRGDSTPVPQWPGTRSPTGVREHGIRPQGFLQEPGRSRHLRRRERR